VRPEHSKETIAFVHRSEAESMLHSCLAVVLCCYSVCRTYVVKQGQIGLTQYGDEPQLLGPGRHTLLSPWNEMLAIKDETEQVIRHGPIFIIKVKRGELGYGIDLNDGHPTLLSQGRHIIKSNTFTFHGFVTLRDRTTILDQIQVIRVEMGWIGYCYRAGNLEIMEPGLHLIAPPDRFGDFLSTQLAILDLPEGVHDTSDYVPLAIKAAVFYRIVDARKALLNIQNIRQQITETSVATLAGIIRSSSLSDVASRSQPFYNKKKVDTDSKESDAQQASNIQQAITQGAGQPFFQHVHDEFITLLHDHVLNSWGIEIQNIRIESLKIFDDQLQKDISAQAIDVSKQHNRFIMLQKQQAIVTVEAETRATQTRIDTEAATGMIRAKAQADADAIVIKATADKEALRLKGQGESDYAKQVESTNLGRQLAAMQVQADALKGLKQVAYVPHLPGLITKGRGVFSVGQEMLMPNMKEEE